MAEIAYSIRDSYIEDPQYYGARCRLPTQQRVSSLSQRQQNLKSERHEGDRTFYVKIDVEDEVASGTHTLYYPLRVMHNRAAVSDYIGIIER